MTSPFPPSPPNPWITHGTQTCFRSHWILVERNLVTTPSGSEADYGVVRFRNKAVGVIPYENGKIWMVGQTRYALDAYSWEIPEGGVSIYENEAMEDAARRELAEETGLRAKTLTPLFKVHTSNSITDEWGQVFLARGLTQGESAPEDTEDITVVSLPLEQAYQAVEDGHITDSLSIAAIYKLRLMQALGELE